MKRKKMKTVIATAIVTSDGDPASEQWVFLDGFSADEALEEIQLGYDEPVRLVTVEIREIDAPKRRKAVRK